MKLLQAVKIILFFSLLITVWPSSTHAEFKIEMRPLPEDEHVIELPEYDPRVKGQISMLKNFFGLLEFMPERQKRGILIENTVTIKTALNDLISALNSGVPLLPDNWAESLEGIPLILPIGPFEKKGADLDMTIALLSRPLSSSRPLYLRILVGDKLFRAPVPAEIMKHILSLNANFYTQLAYSKENEYTVKKIWQSITNNFQIIFSMYQNGNHLEILANNPIAQSEIEIDESGKPSFTALLTENDNFIFLIPQKEEENPTDSISIKEWIDQNSRRDLMTVMELITQHWSSKTSQSETIDTEKKEPNIAIKTTYRPPDAEGDVAPIKATLILLDKTPYIRLPSGRMIKLSLSEAERIVLFTITVFQDPDIDDNRIKLLFDAAEAASAANNENLKWIGVDHYIPLPPVKRNARPAAFEVTLSDLARALVVKDKETINLFLPGEIEPRSISPSETLEMFRKMKKAPRRITGRDIEEAIKEMRRMDYRGR